MKKHLYYLIGLVMATALLVPASVFAEDEPEPSGNPDQIYTLTFDFNGGATFDDRDTLVRESVGDAPILNEPFLVSCIDYDAEGDECHSLAIKKGKAIDYITVNDERYEFDAEESFMLDQDTVIKYYWIDVDLPEYTVESEGGDSVTFEEEGGHTFHLNVNKFSFSMTDEELEAMELTREEYEAGKAIVTEAVEDYGPTILYIEIEIYDEEDHPITQGPFDIKIKYTEEMAGYDSYKLVYVEMDEDNNVVVVEEGATLTLDETGEFLVGTLEHLSGYALVGVTNAPGAPDTGEFVNNPSATVSLFAVIGTLTLAGAAVTLRKR